MSYTLLIETTLQGSTLAIARLNGKSEIIWFGGSLENRGSSSALSYLLEAGLQCNSMKINDISSAVVAIGPGSFTGIKVGLSFVSGLFRGSEGKLSILGISSLPLILSQLTRMQNLTTGMVILPSTKDQGYAAYIDDLKDGNFGMELHNIDVANLNALIKAKDMEKYFVIGDWPALQKCDKSFEIVDLSCASFLSINGLFENARSLSPEGFRHDLPEARYLRNPSIFGMS